MTNYKSRISFLIDEDYDNEEAIYPPANQYEIGFFIDVDIDTLSNVVGDETFWLNFEEPLEKKYNYLTDVIHENVFDSTLRRDIDSLEYIFYGTGDLGGCVYPDKKKALLIVSDYRDEVSKYFNISDIFITKL